MNQIPNRIVVEQIACGQNHTVFLSCAGTAYTAGSNIRGQLGIGKRSRMEGFSKVSGLEFKEVSQIACGQTHTVFLTYENQVYVCGSNSSGELGIDSGDFEDRVTPTKLHHYQLDKVKMIACGGWNTVFVSTRNDIMVCGCNEEGQVGIKQLSNGPFHSKNGVVPLPQQLLHEKFYRKWHVVHAACGMRHMLLYCTDEPEIVTPHFFNLPQSRQEGQYADVLFVQRQ
jgi:alpha-tubulin suppressor-like RCC1 family protein